MDNTLETNTVLLQNNEKREIQPTYGNLYLSKRFFIAMLIFIGNIFLISLRINLSMAIVQMTAGKNLSTTNETDNLPEFKWDSKQRGIALSAFSYGYLFCPIGGILASRFGGVTIYGIGIFITAFTTLLTPFLVRFHFILFLLSRIVEGLFEGFAMTSIPEILSRWSPSDERSTLSGLTSTGFHFGSMLSFPIAGFIANTWGWEFIFYATGTAPIVWCIVWFTLVSNDPAVDRFISKSERSYLKFKVNRKLDDKVEYDWKSILESKPVWAVCVAKLVYSCGYTFMIFYLPQFLKDTNNVNINEIGFISAMPHLCSAFGNLLASILADYLRNSWKITPTQVHKLYFAVGYFLGAALFVITAFTGIYGSMIALSLQRLLFSGVEVGFFVIILDLAPRYAGLLFGISTVFFVTGTIICPTFVGYIVTTHNQSEWNICFLTFGIVYVFGGIFFMLFGSGKQQTWAMSSEEKRRRCIKTLKT